MCTAHSHVTSDVVAQLNAGTIMGVSQYLKEENPNIQIVGLQPSEGASIAGIRRWPKQYLPKIFQVDAHCNCALVGSHSEACWCLTCGCSSCVCRCTSLSRVVSTMQEERVDRVMEIGQREAEEAMRALAKVEGIFAGGSTWLC